MKQPLMRVWMGLLLACFAFACDDAAAGPDAAISDAAHDSGASVPCSFDNDCVLSGCDECGCATTSQLVGQSVDAGSCEAASPCPCEPLTPTCVEGSCGSRLEFYTDQNYYDRTCTEDADCTVIAVDEVCSACACPTGAINRIDESRYLEDRARFACAVAPADCACEQFEASCVEGTCRAVAP